MLYFTPTDNPASILLFRPLYIQIITGIEDSEYYTRKSVDQCKESLELLRILGNDLAVLATCKIQKAGVIQSGGTKIL